MDPGAASPFFWSRNCRWLDPLVSESSSIRTHASTVKLSPPKLSSPPVSGTVTYPSPPIRAAVRFGWVVRGTVSSGTSAIRGTSVAVPSSPLGPESRNGPAFASNRQ